MNMRVNKGENVIIVLVKSKIHKITPVSNFMCVNSSYWTYYFVYIFKLLNLNYTYGDKSVRESSQIALLDNIILCKRTHELVNPAG